MFDKIKNLKGTSKALVIGCIVMGVITVGLVIAVLATGGFSNPIG